MQADNGKFGDSEPRRVKLDADTVDRIHCVALALREVHPASFEEWEVAFMRAEDVERELLTWECLAETYTDIVERFHVPRRKAREVWGILLLLSMDGGGDVLAGFPLVLLTPQERDAVAHHFRSRLSRLPGGD